MKILCAAGIHKWAPWSSPMLCEKRPFPVMSPDYKQAAIGQARVCVRCQKIVMREVCSKERA